MLNNVPQISRRRIGAVVIIDLRGELIGPWALRAKESIQTLIANCGSENILINLKDLSTVDSLGVKAVIDNFPKNTRGGIVSGKLSVMEMFSRLMKSDNVKIFNNEEDVVSYFALDFVKDNKVSPVIELRKTPRLKTALPLEFWFEDKSGDKVTFKAIITDLSEGGLFAEYLDVESLEDFNRCFELAELKHLNMKIKLPQIDYIYVEGKVARTVIAGEQVGIGVEFLNLQDNDKENIRIFLQN
ncbi:PilZ domain-containing protein [Candidatus Omnitrophota bacterium]